MTFFDTPNEAASKQYSPLEPGTYRMLVETTESKTSQQGIPYLSMTLACIDEPNKGRKVWQNFFLQHPKEDVRAISRGQLKAFLEAIGHAEPLQYENDFHRVAAHKVLPVAIGIRKNQQGEEQNSVRSFLPKDAPRTATSVAPPAKAQPQQQASNWTQDPSLSDIPFMRRYDNA